MTTLFDLTSHRHIVESDLEFHVCLVGGQLLSPDRVESLTRSRSGHEVNLKVVAVYAFEESHLVLETRIKLHGLILARPPFRGGRRVVQAGQELTVTHEVILTY